MEILGLYASWQKKHTLIAESTEWRSTHSASYVSLITVYKLLVAATVAIKNTKKNNDAEPGIDTKIIMYSTLLFLSLTYRSTSCDMLHVCQNISWKHLINVMLYYTLGLFITQGKMLHQKLSFQSTSIDNSEWMWSCIIGNNIDVYNAIYTQNSSE